MVDAVEPGNAFAEKLGLWIHFTDAIALSAVHDDSPAGTADRQPDVQTGAQDAVREDVARIRTILANAIRKSCSPNAGKAHLALPEPRLELPMDLAATFLPYRRFYEAQQRDMEMAIQPLRVNVRQVLGRTSPGHRKLAELDATMEKILRERERKLLSTVPILLKKRFEQLFKAHQQTLAASQQEDKPAGWMAADGWLARFCQDIQMLLLAELELRLQPTIGLIEAFTPHNE